jgi:glycosyltransferase involved in cell wall biosynthesis
VAVAIRADQNDPPVVMPIKQSETLELSVVMPCLNEAETLETCIRKAQRALREANIAGEIVVADNGSDDGSIEIAERLGAKIVNVRAKGYGNALMGGIAVASGNYIVMGDADDSYDFGHIPRFVEQLRKGADLVMGNRFRGGIQKDAMPPLHRYFGNPALTTLGRLFFRSGVGDIYCGLRGFRKDAYQRMALRTTGMEFATEMVVKAMLLELRIAEVPTTLSPDGRNRPPHLRTWRDGWRTLRFFLLYSPRWLFLYPGMALMMVGLLLGLWLLPGPRAVGNVTFDVHTMVYAAAFVLLGFQSIAFAVFTKFFAISDRITSS